MAVRRFSKPRYWNHLANFFTYWRHFSPERFTATSPF
ncbi:hypothetical protein PENANT_c001G09558 [Penicillium antarcticum]|uniref:Uncharacterized protein n=1 Tax=Penicillium antarcticum TaxID=416450 RepID=A0A1V6QPH4_9EURO|nr:hypothetical protein PENANT_c001G09558 [Penicillium antarcticum]